MHLIEMRRYFLHGGIVVNTDIVKIRNLICNGNHRLPGGLCRGDHILPHLGIADIVQIYNNAVEIV